MKPHPPLILHGGTNIPDSYLSRPETYKQELGLTLRESSCEWVIWNPILTAVHRSLPNPLLQSIVRNTDAAILAIGLPLSCFLSAPAVRNPFPSWETAGGQAAKACPSLLPFLWKKDYLIEMLASPLSPLPSSLYLPYEWMPNSSSLEPLPQSIFKSSARGGSQKREIGLKFRIPALQQQLAGIVPILTGTRRNVPASGMTNSNCPQFDPAARLLTHECKLDSPSHETGINPASALPRNYCTGKESPGECVLPARDKAFSATFKPHSPVPEVSILLPVYNMRREVGWAVRSILAQTSPNWELLIGDDGSEDGTADLPYLYSDPRIQVHRFSPNRGKAFVLNELLPLARGRYVLELDGDDWLQPEAVAQLTAIMDRSPEAAIATGGSALWQGTRHLGPLWRGVQPYRGHRADPAGAAPLVPRFYRAAMLRGIGGWPIPAGDDGRLFEDIAVCGALLAEHPEPAVVDRPLYNRVLRASSVSQRGSRKYPAWIQNLADNKKGGHL